jgi:hypothetical protein
MVEGSGVMESQGRKSLESGLALRLHKALTAGHEELFALIRDTSAEVVRAALKNRSLTEDHLLALLKRRDLPEDLLKAIHQRNDTGRSHRLLLALAKNPGTPGPVILSILPHLYLFELLDLCILPGTTPDQKLAAERQIIRRLPTTPLGNKITLARRGTSAVVAELLKGAEAQVIAACLDSPALREIDLLQLLNGPGAGAETVSLIARHPRWRGRPNLRLAILKSPKTPPIWFTLFLPQLKKGDLQSIVASRRLDAARKSLIENELKRRGLKSS